MALFAAVVGFALPAAAGAAPAGSISGTVTAKVGGAALKGVEVCAFPTVGGDEEEPCGTTDSEGEYLLPGLPAGEYEVEFWGRMIGYLNQTYPTPVTVLAGEPSTGIDAELEKGASIKGTVTAAATGLPVSGVVACAFTADEDEEGGCSTTGPTGAYAIEGLAAGRYEVFFSTAELGGELISQPYAGGSFVLAARQELVGIDAALQKGGQIEGTVRLAATGAPLQGVEVCITEATEAFALGCLKTPASGRYRFTRLWPEAFKVVFSPETSEFVEVESGEITPDAYPTQWWNGQPSFAAASPIGVGPAAIIGGIDGSLGPGPAPVTSPAPAPVTPPATVVVKPRPKPKALKCKRGFVTKKVKGKADRCVKRHKPKRHHHPHRP